jgi:hypothetical protein
MPGVHRPSQGERGRRFDGQARVRHLRREQASGLGCSARAAPFRRRVGDRRHSVSVLQQGPGGAPADRRPQHEQPERDGPRRHAQLGAGGSRRRRRSTRRRCAVRPWRAPAAYRRLRASGQTSMRPRQVVWTHEVAVTATRATQEAISTRRTSVTWARGVVRIAAPSRMSGHVSWRNALRPIPPPYAPRNQPERDTRPAVAAAEDVAPREGVQEGSRRCGASAPTSRIGSEIDPQQVKHLPHPAGDDH